MVDEYLTQLGRHRVTLFSSTQDFNVTTVMGILRLYDRGILRTLSKAIRACDLVQAGR